MAMHSRIAHIEAVDSRITGVLTPDYGSVVMSSAPLVELYESLRDLPWDSLTLEGGTDPFSYRLVGRLTEREVAITIDDDPRAINRRWVVEIEKVHPSGTREAAEFHLFEGDQPLADYLRRLSEEST